MSFNTSATPSTVSTHTIFFREKNHQYFVLAPISTSSQTSTPSNMSATLHPPIPTFLSTLSSHPAYLAGLPIQGNNFSGRTCNFKKQALDLYMSCYSQEFPPPRNSWRKLNQNMLKRSEPVVHTYRA